MPRHNPLALLTDAFIRGNRETCLEILTGIYFYVFRSQPPKSVRKGWREELKTIRAEELERELTLKFFHNKVRRSSYYGLHIDTTGKNPYSHFTYSNDSNMMDLGFAPHQKLVRRMCQLEGKYPKEY